MTGLGWAAAVMAAEPEISVRTSLAERGGAGVTVVVWTSTPAGGALEAADPAVTGALGVVADEPRVEQIDDRTVTTRRYTVRLPTGHHHVDPLTVRWTDGSTERTATAPALWFDVGPPPSGLEPLEDILEPRSTQVAWGRWAVGAVLVAGVAGAAAWALRPARVAAAPPVPLDQATLDAWKAAQADPTLDPMARAVLLARLTRTWLARALMFPADAWTRPAVVAHLGSMVALPPEVAVRVDRLLSATDLVKYADHAVPAEAWTRFGSDLAQVVALTRPKGEPS